MSSLRARLRAERECAGEASTSRSFECARVEEKMVNASENIARTSPRTPRDVRGSWNSSTRTATWDSARGSGEDGSARRRWRTLAKAEREARESGSGGKVSVMTESARRVFSSDIYARRRGEEAFASVVKASREPKRHASLTASPETNTEQAFAESSLARGANQRDIHSLVVGEVGGKGKADPSARTISGGDREMKLALEVEEEVLKILRSVVEDARKERREAVMSTTALPTVCLHSKDDEKAVEQEQSESVLMSSETALDPNIAVVQGSAKRPEIEKECRIRGIHMLTFIGAMVFAALCGYGLALSLKRGDENTRPSSERALTLADFDLDASWIAALDRARIFHDSLMDESARRRLRSAAKRARDARREALNIVANRGDATISTASSNDDLAGATCRAVRAFAELDASLKGAD